MKAVTVFFGNEYVKLKDTFVASWNRNCDIPIEVIEIDPPNIGDQVPGYYFNHAKLSAWVEAVQGDTILIDCDMLCISDISDGFGTVHHIGITEKRSGSPINAGVVFVRDNPLSRAFLEKWIEVDGKMLHDPAFHSTYWKVYRGMNQSSLGWMIENGYNDIVTRLPCNTYNLCDGEWENWRESKMIHIKGFLRQKVLKDNLLPTQDESYMKDIKTEWDKYTP